jgi:hypothetical protein
MSRILNAAAALTLLTTPAASFDVSQSQKVTGYFCEKPGDLETFLTLKAKGENSLMAANAVNKLVGKQTCAPWNINAVAGKARTAMRDGLVFNTQAFTFPDEVERYTGSVIGNISQQAQREQDI